MEVKKPRPFGLWDVFFLALQAVSAWFAYHWWNYLPPTGYAVAVIAVAAAAMSIQGEMRGWQKAIWMLVIGAFLIIELKAIKKDKTDYDNQQACIRQQETANFAAISSGLQEAITESDQHFQATMKSTNALLSSATTTAGLAHQAVSGITGGNSYLVITPIMIPTQNSFPLMLQVVGKDPMWDVNTSIVEKHEYESSTETYEAFVKQMTGGGPSRPIYGAYSSSPGAVFPLTGQTISPHPNTSNIYYINTQARNGNTSETLTLMFNSDIKRWQYSCSIMRIIGTKGTPIKSKSCDGTWIKFEIYISRPPS